jgi:2-methylaconitate cis-trans-isomerase PrpF/tripartite-type tricarboxylate transporter receptor subunit TctC
VKPVTDPVANLVTDVSRAVPCVLMRGGTSRGPFFLREWLPADDVARDEALVGAIGASDLLQVDGVGGGSTLTSKVAIVSRSTRPGCDVDYLFAQVGVGQRAVDTRPNCGNMLSGVGPFAIEQGLVPAADGTTTVRVFNVNTSSRIDVEVQTPDGRVTYVGDTRIDGVAGTGAPVRMSFLDAWGATTGAVFPTGRRIDVIDGVELTCIDAAMPLMIVRAADLGVRGHETPEELDAHPTLRTRLESLRRAAGAAMGLGDVSGIVVPKPVLVSDGDDAASVTSRYFTPHRCHTSHAVTGAIGVASAFALPGTVAGRDDLPTGTQQITVLHPQGRIEVEIEARRDDGEVVVARAALVRTARKIFQGDLHLPDYVFSGADRARGSVPVAGAARPVRLIVPTPAGGANDAIARTLAQRLGPILGRPVVVDNRAGAGGAIAAEHVARATPDGSTLLLGYVATHGMHPALQPLGYDPVADFAPVGLVGYSPTVLVTGPGVTARTVRELVAQLRSGTPYTYASAGDGTAPHFAAELFALAAGVDIAGVTFGGSSAALAETVAGRTDLMFSSLFTAYPWIGAERLRALAVAGPRRLDALPDLPTLHESGIAGVDVTQWYGVFAPAKTPAAVVDELNAALNDVLARADAVRLIAAQGIDVVPGSPSDLARLVDSELATWRRVVAEAGLAPQR